MNAFEKLLVDLTRASVDFILVGGMAVAYAGYVRTTEDVDILVQADTANIGRLLRVLKDFGEGHARELSETDFTMEEGAIRIVEDFPLDVFVQMNEHTYEDLTAYTGEQKVGGITILHLSAEGLVMLKADSVRPKDQQDVQALRQIIDESVE